MAQFLGSVQGQRGEATRLGSKSSGLTARVNGWHVGVRVEASHEDGKDVFRIYRTGGSSGFASQLIAEFSEE
jgi:hypothetical protein